MHPICIEKKIGRHPMCDNCKGWKSLWDRTMACRSVAAPDDSIILPTIIEIHKKPE
ncbi:hypothetical protein BDV28DRAFT_132278 [Aspergillus coremiiformis]|uniref:Uncharacterized protein n=1 Tax=Aspergillus coremiiformis TaxID=138285 RepID=A0A5N6Z9M5_9EURO|nr:hypothetical protein BDV28DRAFT_132278 [Aspergillus coremiiformis]